MFLIVFTYSDHPTVAGLISQLIISDFQAKLGHVVL